MASSEANQARHGSRAEAYLNSTSSTRDALWAQRNDVKAGLPQAAAGCW